MSRTDDNENRLLGSRTCPKGLNPADAITKLKLEMALD